MKTENYKYALQVLNGRFVFMFVDKKPIPDCL
jgi:hypothetical protein